MLLPSGWRSTVLAFAHHSDPYPFILLNLVLSCVAALQAPVIMMSQNRQELRDRLQADSDYRVNVKLGGTGFLPDRSAAKAVARQPCRSCSGR